MELEEVLLAAAAISAPKDEQRIAIGDGLRTASQAGQCQQEAAEQRRNLAAAYRVPSAGGVAVAGRLDAFPDAVVVQLLVLP